MKPFSVVTQFYTANNSPNGTLSEIRRLYVQNGKVIENARITVPGLEGAGAISDSYCAKSKEVLGGTDAFTALGGLKQMGEAIGRGMVLALSIWDDSGSYMNWLDQDPNGPCPATSGRPDDLIKQYPDSKVIFSNIRSGDIGSTFKNGTTVAGRRSIRRF
jgi:cellulose 1,4-beta-cellobiosidase